MRVIRFRADDFAGILPEESALFFKAPDGRFAFLLYAGGAEDPEERLYLGDVQNQLNLLQLAAMDEDRSGAPRERYLRARARVQDEIESHALRVIGGGACGADGAVTDWHALLFKKETPEEWRATVQSVIRATLRPGVADDDPDITLS